MSVNREQVLLLPKATTVALGFLVSLVAVLMIPLIAYAEEPANIEAPAEVVEGVESPGIPVGSSPEDSSNIIWAWTPPARGLTPDAVQPENPEEAPAERPTDIVQFGYELSLQGSVVASGVVDSSVLGVTIPVSVDGNYILSVWSITRSEAVSAPASGSFAFVLPVAELPNLPPIEVPKPIDTSPVTNNPVATGSSVVGSSPVINKDSDGYVTGNTKANALSVEEASEEAVAGASVAAVVKPSTQGWLIMGIAWYIWIVVLIGVFFVGRWIYAYVYSR